MRERRSLLLLMVGCGAGTALFFKSYRQALKVALSRDTDLLASATALAENQNEDGNDPGESLVRIEGRI